MLRIIREEVKDNLRAVVREVFRKELRSVVAFVTGRGTVKHKRASEGND